MPNDLIIVGSIVAVVWLVILVLRVPAFVAFFSLLVGQVLAGQIRLNFKYSDAVLIVAPMLVTMFLLRHRVPKSKLMMEFLPGLCVAVATVSFVYPVVYAVQQAVNQVSNYQFAKYRPWVLVATSVIVLVFALINYPKNHDESKKHH